MKKKEEIKKIRLKKQPREYWQPCVKVFYDFCAKNFVEPSFDGSAPRDLGSIMDAIKKKCDDAEIEYTLAIAVKSLFVFLQFALTDKWLKENFMLHNLNRQKDKIFFLIKKSKDERIKERENERAKISSGHSEAGSGYTHGTGNFGKLQ